MAISSLETHILELIGENTTTPDVFTDTDSGMLQIRDSVNDAVEEISLLKGSHKAIYHLPLVADQAFYRLRMGRGEFGWVTDAWLVNEKRRLVQTDITRLGMEDPRWMERSGRPTHYFHVGQDVVGIHQKPSGTSDVLELTVAVIPERYTSGTDRVKIRDDFKWAVVHYAVSEYWASRGDAVSALDHFQKYLTAINMQKLYPKMNDRFVKFGSPKREQ